MKTLSRLLRVKPRSLLYKGLIGPFGKTDFVPEVRYNVTRFLDEAYRTLPLAGPVLDVAPQDHTFSTRLFSAAFEYQTLDIDPDSGADIIADLCDAPVVPDARYGTVICTEVLEHVLDPFAAAGELYRILKPGGHLLLSTPFNLRIHGPRPDCWRFTEDGLRVLLKRFAEVDIRPLVAPFRSAMPIHYTCVAKKPA